MERKNTRADIVLAALLVLGSLVLAAFSWWLPTNLQAPMTAEMVGKISAIGNVYGNYRMGISIDDNSTKYTFIMETYEALPKKPEVGDDVVLKYDISSMHDIRYLEVRHDDGSVEVLHAEENPVAKEIARKQTIAFVVYGVFAAICVCGYLVKTKKRV